MPIRALIPSLIVAVVVGALALALGQGRGGATASSSASARPVVASGKAVELKIANYAFVPPALTVKAGTVVTVRNVDSTAHTATAGGGAFDSGSVAPGGTARLVLKRAGTYHYICQFHAFMNGTITVAP